jgi:branched-chain amino acid transport system permease protein
MDLSFDLLGNALVSGLLLGGFYAAVTVGVSISFGMLDIVNIAHPAFIILGSYTAYIANSVFGFDPILTSIVLMPAFYLLGVAIYHVYDVSFERRGDASIRGLAFSPWCWSSGSITAWWTRPTSGQACMSASSTCRCGC